MKVFQIVNSPDVSLHIKNCMQTVKDNFEDYHLFIEPKIKKPSDSEPFKIQYLLKYPDALFLDWHVVILKKFDFVFSDNVYVYGDLSTGCEGVAIYGNNQIETLKKINEKFEKNMCLHHAIRKINSGIKKIPEGYLIHKSGKENYYGKYGNCQ